MRLVRWVARFLRRRMKIAGMSLGSAALREELRGQLRLLGLGLKVIGTERLLSGGQVLMWNQASHLDHLVLGASIPVPFRSLYNIEVSRMPLYGEWFRRQGHFFVDRFDQAQWCESVSRAAAWVREGNTVLLSPEGTRSWDGGLLPMKRGAFILAIQAQRPIVPMVIYGAQGALPRGRITVARGEIEVELRAPIPTAGYTEEGRGALEALVAGAFRQALAEGPPSQRQGPRPGMRPGMDGPP